MNIPDAAVEAAAKVITSIRRNGQQDPVEAYARAALEAAAPHINAIPCDRDETVPLDNLEFQPTCNDCGEVLIHDYYCGELVYRHKAGADA